MRLELEMDVGHPPLVRIAAGGARFVLALG